MSQLTNNQNKKTNMPRFNLNWLYIVIIVGLGIMFFQGQNNPGSANKEVNFTVFRQYLEKGYAKEVVINKTDDKAVMKLKPESENVRKIFGHGLDRTGNAPTVTTECPPLPDASLSALLDKHGVPVTYETSGNFFLTLLSNLLPIILLVGLWFYLMKRMSGGGGGAANGVFGVGKSKARLFEKGKNGTHITFKDVAGQEGAKQEVQEIVDFLKNPKKYTDLGGKIPKGALLVGPPGTGKTLLAKAVAGEAEVPFLPAAIS